MPTQLLPKIESATLVFTLRFGCSLDEVEIEDVGTSLQVLITHPNLIRFGEPLLTYDREIAASKGIIEVQANVDIAHTGSIDSLQSEVKFLFHDATGDLREFVLFGSEACQADSAELDPELGFYSEQDALLDDADGCWSIYRDYDDDTERLAIVQTEAMAEKLLAALICN